jgi:hypothetical protein
MSRRISSLSWNVDSGQEESPAYRGTLIQVKKNLQLIVKHWFRSRITETETARDKGISSNVVRNGKIKTADVYLRFRYAHMNPQGNMHPSYDEVRKWKLIMLRII